MTKYEYWNIEVVMNKEGMLMYDLDLLEHTDAVNELLARYGVKFGIYKNNTFKEQLFPFDVYYISSDGIKIVV